MLKASLEKAINEQITAEMYSAYLYLSMAAYFEEQNLPGFANWMRVQFEEEQFHAMKFFDYVNERGGRVRLGAIEQPQIEWNGPIDVFEETYKHEQHVTSLINNLMDLAIEERDHAMKSFLNWYIDEQVEEEANVTSLLDQLKLIDGKGHGMLMLDRELSQRSFTAPTE
ncbi:MAG: ferritin [Tissierellales bacterium]|nr:ferritin [Tissierellales bacterium]